MNNVTQLKIKKANVSIHVVRVDNHKMTKATFRQIPIFRLAEKNKELDDFHIVHFPDSVDILGWVNDNGKWLLFQTDGELCRADIKGWNATGVDGVKRPVYDYYQQLYIAT